MAPRTQRRARAAERAPWLFWWAIIGIGLAGLVFLIRTDPGRQAGATGPLSTQAIAAGVEDTSVFLLPPGPTETETPTPTVAPATVSPTWPPLPTAINAPRPSRFGPTPLIPDPDLAAQVAALAGGIPGRFAIAIKDLDTGLGVLIDPETEYPAASLFKLPVMYEVFKQRELGALSLDETLVFTQRHVEFDLGTMDRGAGSTILLSEAVERMIAISDNSSAVLLTDRVGAFNINRDMAGLGFVHTRVLADDLVTSAYDMLLFVEMLARGEGVSPEASQQMLQIMTHQRINDRIPRLLPPGTTVAHKTGNLAGIVSDVGLVSAPEANFAIAVLVQNTTQEGRASQAIAEISAAAYRHFQHSPRPTATPTTVTPTPEKTTTKVPTATVDAPTTVAATATGDAPTTVATTETVAATETATQMLTATLTPGTPAPSLAIRGTARPTGTTVPSISTATATRTPTPSA